MIEYKPAPGTDDVLEQNRIVSVQNDGKLSLTQLWEVIVRTKRLPDGFDVGILYGGVREKLRDPERDVRQHALRVLVDLIPVTQPQSLDDHMRPLVPELLSNLGHPAPALRKGALDTLRIYLHRSKNYDSLLKELISASSETKSVITAAPFLITSRTSNETLKYIINRLWEEVHNQNFPQEIVAKSLARIRYSLGDEKFKMLIGTDMFSELQGICDSYGLPINYRDEDISDRQGGTRDVEEVIEEDKVILETEITLRTGPAITMKLHEESRPNSVCGCAGDSEEEARQNAVVLKVLEDDSESDYYEAARRTPRKVRFGGESVKMRTPESDSSNQDESQSTLRITVTNAVSIKTRRSLIPVRITSLPPTPRKLLPSLADNRLVKSTPNLSGSSSKSKIPLKRGTSIKVPTAGNTEQPKESPKELPVPTEVKASVPTSPEPSSRRNTRVEESHSPLPVHNEIEVFHNLTRSPERQRKSSESPIIDNEKKENAKEITYSSFQVCPEDTRSQPIRQENLRHLPKEKLQFGLNDRLQESIDLYQQFQISSGSTEDEFWNKSEALDNLVKMLKQPNTLETLEPGPAALLFEALFACQHLDKLHFLADDALALLVNGLRLNVLEQCLGRLAQGLCKVGAPSGVNLALMAMKRYPPKKLQMEIIDRCFAHRTREGALQILMATSRLLPSSELEVNKITEFASASLRDRRRRVRHAALETLATLAQLSSNLDVLDTVKRITETSQDHQYLLRVVRTRLSRRQLPTVELDGTVRYSTPRDQTEVEWLSGVTVPSSPPSSSASSSVNYWRRNSRHEGGSSANFGSQSLEDESTNGNQQIWAVDPSVFNKNHGQKEAKRVSGAPLRPVYILQPETVRLSGRGYQRNDRGRSFSPPKPSGGTIPDAAESTPNNINLDAQRRFKYCDGFRKSFSSEQLYCNEKPHREPYSFSLSSRSSTTSTGSSTRSGIWQKDIRSGIPVPISSETKLRLRTNNTHGNSNIGIGPVIARRSALGSPVPSPVRARLSPKENGNGVHLPVPSRPRSSGSESSGYFTPPPDNQQAFVKLDPEDQVSESEEVVTVNDNNNNTPDCVDSFSNNSSNIFLMDNAIQRISSASSSGTVDHNDNKEPEVVKAVDATEPEGHHTLERSEREERRLLRFSSSSLMEPAFSGKFAPVADERRKSKSVVDLQNFLPDISAGRKTTNSAPPFNGDLPNNNTIVSTIEDVPISSLNAIVPVIAEPITDVMESPQEDASSRKLTRRFTRTQSRRSVKATPRSVRESPKSSRTSSKPKDLLQQALVQLNSNEWEITLEGLQSLTKISRQHPDAVEAQIHTVCVTLARHIKNLRSQVARSACYAASELFSSCKRGLDIELEEIAGPLLQRTADTNKFLRADANAALDVMCEQLPANRVIVIITGRGITHPNCIVRSASMRLINDMVKKFGADKVFQMQKEMKDKILFAGAASLTDGSLDARSYAKAMFSHLVGHHQFHKALIDAVPQNTLRHIAKALSSIKPSLT